MSMLSMQIDRLRRLADLYDGTTKPEMAKELQRPYLAQELREAADTIWQLRDDLQRANDAARDVEHDESCAWDRVRKAESEADRLREERDMYRDLVDNMVHHDIPDQLAAENAKLREMCAELLKIAERHDTEWLHWPEMHAELRKLGVGGNE